MGDITGRIHGEYGIYSNGEYVVLIGKNFWILRPEGIEVAYRKDICRNGAVAFLSENRILVAGGKDKYHLVCLDNGKDLLTIPQPKMDFLVRPLVISHDERFAYQYFKRNDRLYFLMLDLFTGGAEQWEVQCGFCATTDLLIDNNDVPCLLQSHLCRVAGVVEAHNGVVYQDPDSVNRGSCYDWQTKWHTGIDEQALFFFGDTDHVLQGNLYVRELSTGVVYNLLENSSEFRVPTRPPFKCWFDKEKRYSFLRFDDCHVVVNLSQRRVAASYVAKGGDGCLVHDMYWVCTDQKICKKPFPVIEEIPKAHSLVRNPIR